MLFGFVVTGSVIETNHRITARTVDKLLSVSFLPFFLIMYLPILEMRRYILIQFRFQVFDPFSFFLIFLKLGVTTEFVDHDQIPIIPPTMVTDELVDEHFVISM